MGTRRDCAALHVCGSSYGFTVARCVHTALRETTQMRCLQGRSLSSPEIQSMQVLSWGVHWSSIAISPDIHPHIHADSIDRTFKVRHTYQQYQASPASDSDAVLDGVRGLE